MMKKVLGFVLLVAVLMTTTIGFAEESAIAKLNDLETEIYEALLIMLENFYSPTSARIMEMGYYADNSRSRDPNDEFFGPHYPEWGEPDFVILKIMAANGVGATTTKYYQLYLTDWVNPDKGEEAKAGIELGKLLGTELYSVYYRHYCEKGFYEELSESSVYVESMDDRPVWGADIGNINRALKEHWEDLGL